MMVNCIDEWMNT